MAESDKPLLPWIEEFLTGLEPPQVQVIPPQLRDPLRQYLQDLWTKRKRQASTLKIHGHSLIDFLGWLGRSSPGILLGDVLPDHTNLYLEEFQSDGRAQGLRTRREGLTKSVRTMSGKAGILRAFFDWAKSRRLCNSNPLHDLDIQWGLREIHPLSEDQVAHLVTAWTDPNAHPRTATVGLLCLLYGLTVGGLFDLSVDDLDLSQMIFRGLKVPAPIPSWLGPVLSRYLVWRATALGDRVTDRLIVTRWSRNDVPNLCLMTQLLKPYNVTVRQLRITAKAQTIFYGHMKLLTVYGMTNEGMRRYQPIARFTQNTRPVKPKPNLW